MLRSSYECWLVCIDGKTESWEVTLFITDLASGAPVTDLFLIAALAVTFYLGARKEPLTLSGPIAGSGSLMSKGGAGLLLGNAELDLVLSFLQTNAAGFSAQLCVAIFPGRPGSEVPAGQAPRFLELGSQSRQASPTLVIHEQEWGSGLVPRAVIQSGVGWFHRGLAAKGTHMRAEKQAGQGRREQRIRKG